MPRAIPRNNSDLVTVNRSLQVLGDGRLATFRVADLPAQGLEPGTFVFALDALKDGETAGAGTGCPAYWDGTGWYRGSDDSAISA